MNPKIDDYLISSSLVEIPFASTFQYEDLADVIQEMKNDETSAAYIPLHLEEIFNQRLIGERDYLISQIMTQVDSDHIRYLRVIDKKQTEMLDRLKHDLEMLSPMKRTEVTPARNISTKDDSKHENRKISEEKKFFDGQHEAEVTVTALENLNEAFKAQQEVSTRLIAENSTLKSDLRALGSQKAILETKAGQLEIDLALAHEKLTACEQQLFDQQQILNKILPSSKSRNKGRGSVSDAVAPEKSYADLLMEIKVLQESLDETVQRENELERKLEVEIEKKQNQSSQTRTLITQLHELQSKVSQLFVSKTASDPPNFGRKSISSALGETVSENRGTSSLAGEGNELPFVNRDALYTLSEIHGLLDEELFLQRSLRLHQLRDENELIELKRNIRELSPYIHEKDSLADTDQVDVQPRTALNNSQGLRASTHLGPTPQNMSRKTNTRVISFTSAKPQSRATDVKDSMRFSKEETVVEEEREDWNRLVDENEALRTATTSQSDRLNSLSRDNQFLKSKLVEADRNIELLRNVLSKTGSLPSSRAKDSQRGPISRSSQGDSFQESVSSVRLSASASNQVASPHRPEIRTNFSGATDREEPPRTQKQVPDRTAARRCNTRMSLAVARSTKVMHRAVKAASKPPVPIGPAGQGLSKAILSTDHSAISASSLESSAMVLLDAQKAEYEAEIDRLKADLQRTKNEALEMHKHDAATINNMKTKLQVLMDQYHKVNLSSVEYRTTDSPSALVVHTPTHRPKKAGSSPSSSGSRSSPSSQSGSVNPSKKSAVDNQISRISRDQDSPRELIISDPGSKLTSSNISPSCDSKSVAADVQSTGVPTGAISLPEVLLWHQRMVPQISNCRSELTALKEFVVNHLTNEQADIDEIRSLLPQMHIQNQRHWYRQLVTSPLIQGLKTLWLYLKGEGWLHDSVVNGFQDRGIESLWTDSAASFTGLLEGGSMNACDQRLAAENLKASMVQHLEQKFTVATRFQTAERVEWLVKAGTEANEGIRESYESQIKDLMMQHTHEQDMLRRENQELTSLIQKMAASDGNLGHLSLAGEWPGQEMPIGNLAAGTDAIMDGADAVDTDADVQHLLMEESEKFHQLESKLLTMAEKLTSLEA